MINKVFAIKNYKNEAGCWQRMCIVCVLHAVLFNSEERLIMIHEMMEHGGVF